MRADPAHVLDEGASRVRVKVDVARVPSAHRGAQDGNAFLLEEGLGEIDVSAGHVHDGCGELQHVGAPNTLATSRRRSPPAFMMAPMRRSMACTPKRPASASSPSPRGSMKWIIAPTALS